MIPARLAGQRWERLAEAYLHRHGLKTLSRNFRCRLGEIDLIMADGECLVFAEIRFRKSRSHGSGAETVTRSKQARIIRTAQRYLQFHNHRSMHACRFDVVSLGHEQGQMTVDWIRNAFTADAGRAHR